MRLCLIKVNAHGSSWVTLICPRDPHGALQVLDSAKTMGCHSEIAPRGVHQTAIIKIVVKIKAVRTGSYSGRPPPDDGNRRSNLVTERAPIAGPERRDIETSG